MLYVLSEMDCLGYLQGRGIYPDMFFTDTNEFRNRVAMARGVDVLIIMAGGCEFNKNVVNELIRVIRDRANNAEDSGVNSLCVLSDVTLPSIRGYYKYRLSPEQAYPADGYDVSKTPEDVLSKYVCAPVDARMFRRGAGVEELREQVLSIESKDEELLQRLKERQEKLRLAIKA